MNFSRPITTPSISEIEGADAYPKTAIRSVRRRGATACRAHRFTLVELLIVMAVMALILYIAMPAFEKLTKGSGAELAARNVYNYLSLARNCAISNRQRIAVIFPMRGKTDYPSSGIPNDYYNRAYRACIVDTNNKFKRWLPGEPWQFLPTGTIFLDIDKDRDDDPVTNNNDRNNSLDTAKDLIDDVNFEDIGGSNNVDDVAAIIFKPTGKITNTEARYVDIGQGKVEGVNIIVTNPKPESMLTIKVDQFTGRVSYGKD